jgi:hypothetical protein
VEFYEKYKLMAKAIPLELCLPRLCWCLESDGITTIGDLDICSGKYEIGVGFFPLEYLDFTASFIIPSKPCTILSPLSSRAGKKAHVREEVSRD